MNEDLMHEFQKIVAISQQMLAHARREMWDDITLFETQRKELLADFFSRPVNVNDPRLSAGIRSVLDVDREIVRLGAIKRDKLRDALRKLSRNDMLNACSAH